MAYVDGFLIPVPKKNLKNYKRMAQFGKKLWRRHGAIGYFECVGEDLKNKWGAQFPKTLKTRPGETVIFSWIVFKSKAHRNRVNAKVMKDPSINTMAHIPMPFNVKRMNYGGFKVLVH